MADVKPIMQDHKNCILKFKGDFLMGESRPTLESLTTELPRDLTGLSCDAAGMGAWDSTLLTLLMGLQDYGQEKGLIFDVGNMPEGVQRLLNLARAIPERPGTRRAVSKDSLTVRTGKATLKVWNETVDMVSFIGETSQSFGRLLQGKARFRKSDLWVHMEACGPGSLGIITVISLLVGAILAFVGAVQLSMFGAEVFVANLVGLGMVMEMGALMTGIILAGRTGAAFAAQLGTMQVNEEIDALKTMGIPPVDNLVLPRMLALIFMSPLLIIYANTVGMIGGAIVGVFYLNIPPQVFFVRTFEYVTPWLMAQGMIKGCSFGLLVAYSGCLRGMQCGRSASEVGNAATRAVVTSLLLIVIADAIWTFLFILMG
ncbi:ABC transporter permease [Kiritimatiellaeota bacterium B1221]|nr:ABC transporter permease [Kiritimatiellaeota bacterium B1221]